MFGPYMWWVGFSPESLWLRCPELTDLLKGRERTKNLRALGAILGIEDGDRRGDTLAAAL